MSVMLKASGLHTFTNDLDAVPQGALLKASNTVIDRDGVIESRRGFKQYGEVGITVNNYAKQLLTYKNRILAHYTDKLSFDNGIGTFTDFDGTYGELEEGLRIKGLEANGNFYFTTNTGIKKISATNADQFTNANDYIVDAGGVEALDVSAIPNYSTPGFLLPQSKVAYRVVWAYKDNNENLILGPPSSNIVVTNPTTFSAVVDIEFAIPEEIPSSDTIHYYQIYRTAVKEKGILPSLDDIDPGDEMQLVIEDYPTTSELTDRVVALTDVTPDSFRANGAYLYTNLNSGEGILQANTAPPIAKDVAMFQGSIFYANTTTSQSLDLSFLSVDQLVSGSSNVTITNGIDANTYTFVGTRSFTVVIFNTIDNINDGGYFLISSSNNIRKYYVWADKTGEGIPDVGVDRDDHLPVRVDLSFSETTDSSDSVSNSFSGGAFSITTEQTANKGLNQVTEITFDALSEINDGGYFFINSDGDERQYFLWANVSGSTPKPVGPDLEGKIGYEINIPTLATAEQVAEQAEITINSIIHDIHKDFVVSRTSEVLTIGTAIDIGGRLADALTATTDYAAFHDTPGAVEINYYNSGETDPAVDSAVNPWNVTYINTTSGTGEDIPLKQVGLSLAPTPAQRIDETARSLVRVINQNPDESVYAYYTSGPTDLPGQIQLVTRHVSNPQFFVYANDSITADSFNPSLTTLSNASAAPNIPPNEKYTTITSASHGLLSGTRIVVFNSTTTPSINGVYSISNVTTNTFDIEIETTLSGNLQYGLVVGSVSSFNEVRPNRIYYSKYQQPEAVPIVNYIDIGPKDKAILRILALRDSLFILKEEGIYRLTGSMAPIWTVTLFDASISLLAPDSAVVLNNQIYALTTQGVARIEDTGSGVISRSIEDKIQKIIYQNPYFKKVSFGVSYETDRAYHLWVPYDRGDVIATVCLRFNSFTQSWTEWEKINTSGIVNPLNDRMYLGSATNVIQEERKNLDRTDYADYQTDRFLNNDGIDETTITLNSNLGIRIGDVLSQRQYVTISTFNRLLLKLDLDIGLDEPDFYSTCGMVIGSNLTNHMQLLVNKLNANSHTQNTYSFSGTTDPVVIQEEFNVIIDELNTDDGVHMSDYRKSVGSYDVEGRIIKVINNTNDVVIAIMPPFIVGDMLHFIGISTDIIYAPQDFGDPSSLKQISEGTFIFEDTVFTSAKAGYNSDLSTNYEFVDFQMDGDGNWGNFTWGEQTWGGEGTQVPMRTYVPREKQRCRFLRPRFQHVNAREKYSIFGISFNPRVLSTRAYR